MGGSSGGSSSGAVSYPEYMQTQHTAWLTGVAAHMVTAQTGDNPYTSAVAYDPDCVLNATNYIISLFYDEILAATPGTDWGTYFDSSLAKYSAETITALGTFTFTDVFSDTEMAALVTAYQTDLEARRDTDMLPSFKAGMQNINAVVSSSFVLGSALITSEIARDVAKFSADLYYQNQRNKIDFQNIQASENTAHNANIIKRDGVVVLQENSRMVFAASAASDLVTKELQIIDFYKGLAHTTADANRIKIVAKQEENERTLKYDERDALWDLEVYQHGSNVLASISGAASTTKGQEVSTGASVLGGAMSGAAIGATFGPVGAAVGGIVGGLAGLLA